MNGKKWTKEGENFLSSNYQKMSYSELSESLGRNIEGIKSKLKRMNLVKESLKAKDSKNNLIQKPLIGGANIDKKVYKRRPKSYASKEIKETIPVYIDQKTIIYIKKGEDPEQARKNYFKKREEYLTLNK